MVLNREHGQIFVAQALYSVVVEVDFRDNRACVFKRLCVGGESVVLRRYRNKTRFEVFHGLVSTPVPEFELVCFCAQRVRYHLMPEADAESRILLQQRGYCFVRVVNCGGVSGAV